VDFVGIVQLQHGIAQHHTRVEEREIAVITNTPIMLHQAAQGTQLNVALQDTLLVSLQIQPQPVFPINIIVNIMMFTTPLATTISNAMELETVQLTITRMDLEQHVAPNIRDKLLGIYKNL
jgi:hypothetical protein